MGKGKEQCICEMCTCGNHHCPHNDSLFPQGQFGGDTEQKAEFTEKNADRQRPFRPQETRVGSEQPFGGESTHISAYSLMDNVHKNSLQATTNRGR